MTQQSGEPVRWEGVSVESIRNELAGGQSASMHDTAHALDRVQQLVEEAAAAVRRGLNSLIDYAKGAAADGWAQQVAVLLVFLQDLEGVLPKLVTATTMVAQGFDQVLATINNAFRAGPAPPPFHRQDATLTWLDWPPHEDYEEKIRGDAEDIRLALSSYQADTISALHAVPQVPAKLEGPLGPDDQGGGAPVGPVIGPLPGGPAGRRRVDSVAELPTVPMHSNSLPPRQQPDQWQAGSGGFGPVGRAAEDTALAQTAMPSPIVESDTTPTRRRRFGVAGSSEPPWTPTRQRPSVGNSYFEPDSPTIEPVIGE